jgi:hypothetical protein
VECGHRSRGRAASEARIPQTRADLEVSHAEAGSADIVAATVDTISAREAKITCLKAESLDTGLLTSESLEASRVKASVAEVRSLCAEGIVLVGGSLDARGGQVDMGAATAHLLRTDEVCALSVMAETASVGDARADTLTVTGAVAAGSVTTQDITALGVLANRVEASDLHVSGQCALHGEVHFDRPVLKLPARRVPTP